MSARTPERLLGDLADLCHETAEHLRGVDIEEFLGSKSLQRAIERTLELIGEVSNRLGKDRPNLDVPWDEMSKMRILLAHVYHRVDPRLLFNTATIEVPKLLRALESLERRKE